MDYLFLRTNQFCIQMQTSFVAITLCLLFFQSLVSLLSMVKLTFSISLEPIGYSTLLHLTYLLSMVLCSFPKISGDIWLLFLTASSHLEIIDFYSNKAISPEASILYKSNNSTDIVHYPLHSMDSLCSTTTEHLCTTILIFLGKCNKELLFGSQNLSKCLLLSESRPLWDFFSYTSTLRNYLEDFYYNCPFFHWTTLSIASSVPMDCKNTKVILHPLITSWLNKE